MKFPGIMRWELPNGTELGAWTSELNRPGRPSYIWADVLRGPVKYRIVSRETATPWKPMRRSEVTDDGRIVPSPECPFGAVAVLKRGNYDVEFRVQSQVFSGLKLIV